MLMPTNHTRLFCSTVEIGMVVLYCMETEMDWEKLRDEVWGYYVRILKIERPPMEWLNDAIDLLILLGLIEMRNGVVYLADRTLPNESQSRLA